MDKNNTRAEGTTVMTMMMLEEMPLLGATEVTGAGAGDGVGEGVVDPACCEQAITDKV